MTYEILERSEKSFKSINTIFQVDPSDSIPADESKPKTDKIGYKSNVVTTTTTNAVSNDSTEDSKENASNKAKPQSSNKPDFFDESKSYEENVAAVVKEMITKDKKIGQTVSYFTENILGDFNLIRKKFENGIVDQNYGKNEEKSKANFASLFYELIFLLYDKYIIKKLEEKFGIKIDINNVPVQKLTGSSSFDIIISDKREYELALHLKVDSNRGGGISPTFDKEDASNFHIIMSLENLKQTYENNVENLLNMIKNEIVSRSGEVAKKIFDDIKNEILKLSVSENFSLLNPHRVSKVDVILDKKENEFLKLYEWYYRPDIKDQKIKSKVCYLATKKFIEILSLDYLRKFGIELKERAFKDLSLRFFIKNFRRKSKLLLERQSQSHYKSQFKSQYDKFVEISNSVIEFFEKPESNVYEVPNNDFCNFSKFDSKSDTESGLLTTSKDLNSIHYLLSFCLLKKENLDDITKEINFDNKKINNFKKIVNKLSVIYEIIECSMKRQVNVMVNANKVVSFFLEKEKKDSLIDILCNLVGKDNLQKIQNLINDENVKSVLTSVFENLEKKFENENSVEINTNAIENFKNTFSFNKEDYIRNQLVKFFQSKNFIDYFTQFWNVVYYGGGGNTNSNNMKKYKVFVKFKFSINSIFNKKNNKIEEKYEEIKQDIIDLKNEKIGKERIDAIGKKYVSIFAMPEMIQEEGTLKFFVGNSPAEIFFVPNKSTTRIGTFYLKIGQEKIPFLKIEFRLDGVEFWNKPPQIHFTKEFFRKMEEISK